MEMDVELLIPRTSRRSRTNRDTRDIFQLVRARFQGGARSKHVVD